MAERIEIILTAVDRASAQLRGAMGTLGKFAAQVLTSAAALRAMSEAWDMAEEGAGLLRLRDSGVALAASMGESMDDIVASIRRASLGGISEMDALASANRAMMLGVSSDADTLGRLMEVAALRGRAMGLSTSQAFDDIVRGIGRMSPMILDNLGILTRGLPAGLSATERRAALLAMVLEDGARLLGETGGLARDAASSFERLGAETATAGDRLKMAMGEAFAPFVGMLADIIEGENEWIRTQETILQIIEEFNLEIGERNSYLDEGGNLVARGSDQLFAYAEAQRAATATTDGAVPALDRAAEAARRYAVNLDPVPSIFEDINTNIAGTLETWIGQIEFLAAGGADIQSAAEATRQALLAGAITPEEARGIFQNLLLEADQITVELGDATPWDLARQHADEFGVPISEAYRNITGISDTIRALPSQHVVDIIFRYQTDSSGFTPPAPTGSSGGGGQGGGRPDLWEFEQTLTESLRGMG